MNRNRLRIRTCCLAATIMLAGSGSMAVNAAPAAGLSDELSTTISSVTKESTVAGGTLTFAKAVSDSQKADENKENTDNSSEDKSEKAENETPVVKSEYADIAIAQVDNYVNVRSTPGEDGEVLGKLYDKSAATVEGENGWYKITSGSVTGYVKKEFVVVGNEELARAVGRRMAKVNTETLKVRTDASTDAPVLGLVPGGDDLTVTEERDGWVKVSVEEGEGFVSTDYVSLSTEFVKAESKAEEEARLAKEEAERKAAEEAAAAAARKASQQQSSAPAASSAPARSYAPPSGGNGAAVASYAGQFVGNPYVYGGTSLTNGADCSGFVMSVYAAFGVSLPHSSSAMRGVGYEVSQADMQPGDIVCYSGHVAIYVGNNTIVHASTPESGIKYTSPAAYRSIITVRRIF